MGMVRWLGFAVGLVLLLMTASSVVKTLLIPRATHSTFSSAVAWLVRGAFRRVTMRIDDLGRRERILAFSGPTFLAGLLGFWLACLLAGFGLLLWPLKPGGLPAALVESGSSLFT